MGKHSKKAGVMGSEALTYHERRALGFGTRKERFGKETMGNYDDCVLTLQPAIDPVCTPHGYLYSKEAIIQNLLEQKKAIKRQMAAYEAQLASEQQKEAELAAAAEEAKLLAFDRQNHAGASARLAQQLERTIQEEVAAQLQDKQVVGSVHNIKQNEQRLQEMKAFWVPTQTPGVAATIQKPDGNTYCPASGKKLRLKDLTPVKFTPVPQGQSGRHQDPITHDTFTNKHRLVLLKATGDVMLEETYNKCVKPEGMYNGVRIREVVQLQRGGTGFAAHDGDKLQSSKFFALGPGSGRQDMRGQMAAGKSLGGLQFMN